MGFYVTVFSAGTDKEAGIRAALEKVRFRLEQRQDIVDHGHVGVDEATLAKPAEIPDVQPGIAWYHE